MSFMYEYAIKTGTRNSEVPCRDVRSDPTDEHFIGSFKEKVEQVEGDTVCP